MFSRNYLQTRARHFRITSRSGRSKTLARHAWSDTCSLDLSADLLQSSANIGEFAGAAEARRFLEFCARAKQIFQTLDRTFMRAQRPSPFGLVTASGASGLPQLMRISPFTTLWQELGKYFHDERLRQLFGRYATYCGSSPFHAPATLMLIAHAEQDGVWSIEGGMYRLAQAVAALAERKGVRIHYNSGVRNITAAHGRVSGITLENDEWHPSDAVVFNGDAAAIADGHLGKDIARAVPQVDKRHRSLSAVTWTGLAETRGFPLTRHNVFFSRDYRAEFDDIFYTSARPRGADGLCLRAGPRRRRSERHGPRAASHSDQRSADRRPRVKPGDRVMSRPDLPSTGAMRTDRFDVAGDDAGHDAAGLRLGLSGDGRSALRPGLARLDGIVPPSGSAQPDAGAVSRGRQCASGAGRADGGDIGAAGSAGFDAGSRFDQPVPHNGYAWWYVDGLSDDGRYGLTVIAFIGSVFSPYYARARRRGMADPSDYCAINAVLYGPRGKRWAMTERDRHALSRSDRHLCIGRSSLTDGGNELTISHRRNLRALSLPPSRHHSPAARDNGSGRIITSIQPAGMSGGR